MRPLFPTWERWQNLKAGQGPPRGGCCVGRAVSLLSIAVRSSGIFATNNERYIEFHLDFPYSMRIIQYTIHNY